MLVVGVVSKVKASLDAIDVTAVSSGSLVFILTPSCVLKADVLVTNPKQRRRVRRGTNTV